MSAFVPRGIAIVCAILFTLGGAPRAFGGEFKRVPLETQLPVLLKVLTFDKTLTSRSNHEIPVTVVAPPESDGGEGTLAALEAGFESIAKKRVSGRGLRIRILVWQGERAFADSLAADPPEVLYFDAGCDMLIEKALRAMGRKDVLVCGQDPGMVGGGVILSVASRDERLGVLIDAAAAKAAGRAFSPGFLRLCWTLP